MIRFAANLTWLFTEHAFLDRFAAAADAGFTEVECNFPYEAAPERIAAALARHGLEMVLFNLPPGDFASGERGLAGLPARRADFQTSLTTALEYARATGAKLLHVMAGAGPHTNEAAYRDALAWACDTATDVTFVIEPINGRAMPGYLMNDFAMAAGIIADLKRPNLKLLFDIYHCRMLGADVTAGLDALLPIIAHVQIASAPARAEPGSGHGDDAHVLRHLDGLGYKGVVGLEYRPRNGTLAGLPWLRDFRA